MKKIVIVSGIQLINNPRVFKEASYLSQRGYDVTVLAAIYDAESSVRTTDLIRNEVFRHIVVLDGTARSAIERARFLVFRLLGRVSRLLHQWFGWESPLQLGNQVVPLLLEARRQSADLYIVHLESALYVGCKLLDQGEKVAIDIEDWYSEDGLPQDRARRPIGLIRQYEEKLLRNCVYATTTSYALSNALAGSYGCAAPGVVHNAFLFSDRQKVDRKNKDKKDHQGLSLIWFSQTVGPGRGLEVLVEALNLIEGDLRVHIRGTPRVGYEAHLRSLLVARWQDRVHFHPQVPQAELLSRLAEHDIGFAGELSDCRSRALTITNKVFEYMRAGLAIVASDTDGHRELGSQSAGISVYRQANAEDLSTFIKNLIFDPGSLRDAKAANLLAAECKFSWEITSGVISNSVASALSLSSDAISVVESDSV